MALLGSPANVSIEHLRKGAARPRQEPWASKPDTGKW
jgi:lactoylglutathione lyase